MRRERGVRGPVSQTPRLPGGYGRRARTIALSGRTILAAETDAQIPEMVSAASACLALTDSRVGAEVHPAPTLVPADAGSTSSGATDGRGGDSVHVLIAANNEVLRAGVATLIRLHSGFAVSELSAGSVALVEEARARRPDVVLVDVSMSTSLRELLDARGRRAVSDVAVVALMPDEPPDANALRGLFQLGVNGIVTTNDQAQQLCAAVRAVHRGLRWLSPVIGGQLLEGLAPLGPDRPAADAGPGQTSLTGYERRVLALVADGLTVSQIARRIRRSESAVKYHLSNMSAKYQASNRAHLVYLAIRTGELSICRRNGQCKSGLNDSGHTHVDLVT